MMSMCANDYCLTVFRVSSKINGLCERTDDNLNFKNRINITINHDTLVGQCFIIKIYIEFDKNNIIYSEVGLGTSPRRR